MSATNGLSQREIAYCQNNHIPLSSQGQTERLRDLLAFYNSIFLYNHKCDLSGKPMLSIVPPTKNFKVYDIGIWMDDTAWDPLTYGRNYDFSRPFFEQFAALLQVVPVPSRSVVLSTMENSDYTNGVSNAKNCYLIFDCNNCEDCYFSYQMNNAKNIVDCIDINDCELCYGSRHLKNCYNVRFADSCENTSDSTFVFNCRNVKNCFGCTNLTNKEYCVYNQQLTADEYKSKLQHINLGSHSSLEQEKKRFEAFKKGGFIKDLSGYSNENCSGNFLYECKNCTNTFYTSKAQDCEFTIRANGSKDCIMYAIFGINAELIYNSVVCGNNVSNLKFCYGCFVNTHNLEYCMHVSFGSNDCFGSIGLKKKQYCILNKQYTKEQYFDLLPRIKQHMLSTGEYGRFFPKSFSSFYYNKSEAASFMPLNKETALEKGFTWEDEPTERFHSSYTIPDHISTVTADILDQVLSCRLTHKKYRLTKQELSLYQHWQVPIPLISPLERLRLGCLSLQIQVPQTSNCAKCRRTIHTVYTAPAPQVFCENCYQQGMM